MILIESNFIKEHYLRARSSVKEDKFFYLPYTTLINVGLVLFGIILSVSANSPYSWMILMGMSLGLIGDMNNVSINEDKRTFVLGSLIFIVSYLVYSLALISSSKGILLVDLILVGILFLLYLLCLRSAERIPGFQEFGKNKVITTLYPFVLIFLLSRAIINIFVGTLPLLNVILMALGVILIFITDMEFSMNKFIRPVDKMKGPILYPIGQLCIAISTILLI